MNEITNFRGKYDFLSNMYTAKVYFDGKLYPSVENAFQAAKVTDDDIRKMFRVCSSKMAKLEGRTVNLRPDWEVVKLDVMYECLKSKFSNPALREKLLSTTGCELIESNTWGDCFWGVCNGEGENHLGKLLMKVRDELQ